MLKGVFAFSTLLQKPCRKRQETE